MSTVNVVVGASGGIGAALVNALASASPSSLVIAVGRQQCKATAGNIRPYAIEDYSEPSIQICLNHIISEYGKLTTLICCVGTLHDDTKGIKPEKRLEDINANQLSHYFAVNTIIPSLWVKHAAEHFSDQGPAHCVVLSARVGSISDNRVGGWYGYRASKAALNMFIKTAQVEYQRRAKNVALVAYHPGTVDTALSKPFQRNVKPEKLFTPAFTAQQLLSFLPDLDPQQGPFYLDWQGQAIDW
ncbi:SDR family NAD(P)-dependent oxidoreductase [Aestuariibacter salexigens]|uniref:SDR family NAD(P)-dependent oxidoreductase n=1 Tax=Aestuariibacter salexigens TaxID=226010 RepID=UPI0003FB2333|nr:SDR family NAD(P)-dependent oxidoreductase [Aestuariibacter salexigens]